MLHVGLKSQLNRPDPNHSCFAGSLYFYFITTHFLTFQSLQLKDVMQHGPFSKEIINKNYALYTNNFQYACVTIITINIV